jgi:bacillithiol system protein YtxJ
MNWKMLETEDELKNVIALSATKPQAIYKHSTRCGISKFVRNNLEREWQIAEDAMDVYFLDIIAHRPISNLVAELLHVHHESPQMIVVKQGEVIYSSSHDSIDASDVALVLQRSLYRC